MACIDRKGREVVRPDVTTINLEGLEISDVDHDIFSIRDYESTRYYDLRGTLLKQVEAGFPFYFGYAFVKLSDDYDAPYYVLKTDIDPNTGAFTFGILQRFSPQYGWMPSGSDCFVKRRINMFVIAEDSGLKPDYFEGIRMEPANTRTDIQWYPPKEYFDDAEDYASTVKQLEAIYKAFVSDYDAICNEDVSDLAKVVAIMLAAKHIK